MWFLDSPPKKVQRYKFSWRLALQNSSYNTFIRYWKFKMVDFWKKGPKLPKFQKLISQELFRVRWKNFAHFCFLLVGTFEQNLIKIWEDGWQSWKFCPSLHRITLYLVYWLWKFTFHSYFERKNNKVLTFNMVHFPNFKISATL